MNNKRILIVDDNPSLHDDFKKILVGTQNSAEENLKSSAQDLFGEDKTASSPKLDFELNFASQGEEAFNMVLAAEAEKKPYALVFMDVRMPPGWDGITTIEKIWEKVPLAEVVICTAYSDYSFDDVIAKLGLSERLLFLKKPFDSVEVLQMAIAQIKKWNLEQESRRNTDNLEQLVSERTNELVQERARNANNAKLVALGEMAGGIAHEINNPLAIILSNILMQKELLVEEPLNKPMIQKITEKIELTTTRISKIIKGLRAFSRNGDKDPMDSASVKQMVQETLGICGEKFKVHNVGIVFEEDKIPSDLFVECRSTQIIQVLLNLLNNAYDAIDTLSEKWVKIFVEDQGSNIIISITDSGKGIPLEVQAKLFQPFFTTKEIGKGTGLGLGISKGIVEDHNGTLNIDNECPNTRFVITLPKKNLKL